MRAICWLGFPDRVRQVARLGFPDTRLSCAVPPMFDPWATGDLLGDHGDSPGIRTRWGKSLGDWRSKNGYRWFILACIRLAAGEFSPGRALASAADLAGGIEYGRL